MCGIASVINTKSENKEIAKRIFKSILIANESRGHDSTGVLAINRESNDFSLFKDTITSSKLLNRKKFRQVDGDIWIGHTRLATTGEVNIRNAHPLQRRNVFLVHNGVISNHIEIGKSLDFEHQVDSEILIPIVEKKDWDLLQEIKGSANFIAWDKNKQVIYVERHGNPLYYLTLRDLGIVMFSSVGDVLEFISSHYSNGDEVNIFDDDTLITLDMNGKLIGKQESLVFPVEVVETTTRLITPVNNRYTRQYGDRYPEYYESYDEYSAYGKTFEELEEEEEDLICEGCMNEIDVSEYEEGMQEWGFPLCYSCLTELQEANELIRDGKPLDLESEKWKRFEDILVNYLP